MRRRKSGVVTRICPLMGFIWFRAAIRHGDGMREMEFGPYSETEIEVVRNPARGARKGEGTEQRDVFA